MAAVADGEGDLMLAKIDQTSVDGWTAATWAERIRHAWQQGLTAIIESGRLLSAAKAALSHGEWEAMCADSLPFSASTAQRLMAIAADGRITNPAHVQDLPPHWGTLYELTKLTDDEFKQGIEAGAIRPDMERKALINGARSLMGSRVEPSGSLDYFPTPPWATRALVEVVLGMKAFPGKTSILEPACGEGHIAEVLREYCSSVKAADIHAYGYGATGVDFLSAENDERDHDWIITNPPFGELTEQFILLALQRAKRGVAMFVRLQLVEGIARYESIYGPTPPTIVAFFVERVPLCKGLWDPQGDTATAYIWLVWIKDEQPRPPFWIRPGQRQKLTRPDDAERFTTHPVTKARS
jgi:hypothetical protein